MKKIGNKIVAILKDLLSLIWEVIQLFIGAFVFLFLGFIGILYTLIKHIIKKDYKLKVQFKPIIRSVNLLVDCFASASAGELLNDVLKIKKEDNIRYGSWYRTISALTGLRIKFRKTDWFAKFINGLLGKNHCVDAINKEDDFYYTNNRQ